MEKLVCLEGKTVWNNNLGMLIRVNTKTNVATFLVKKTLGDTDSEPSRCSMMSRLFTPWSLLDTADRTAKLGSYRLHSLPHLDAMGAIISKAQHKTEKWSEFFGKGSRTVFLTGLCAGLCSTATWSRNIYTRRLRKRRVQTFDTGTVKSKIYGYTVIK